MSAHTPGPWLVSPHPNPGFGFRIVAPCPSEPEPNGEMFVAQDIGAEANARLMAVAPDLAIVACAAFRLLTPEQCARLTDAEEAAFGRVEEIARAEGR